MNVENVTYSDLTAEMQLLHERLDAAIAQDDSEAERWWLPEAWDGVFNRSEKAAFEARAAELKARARSARTSCWNAAGNLLRCDAAQSLEADADDWRLRSMDCDELAMELASMAPIDGWTGDAANDYAEAVAVQTAAMRELTGVLHSASKAADAGALLNRILLWLGVQAVKEGRIMADVNRAATNDVFYLRSAHWGDVLEAVHPLLNHISSLTNVQDALAMLSTQLGQTITLAQLLEAGGGWPSGIDAAGVEPADLGSTITDFIDTETSITLPASPTPGVCTAGAWR